MDAFADAPVEVPLGLSCIEVRVSGIPCVTWSQVAELSVPACTVVAVSRAAAATKDKNNRLRIGWFLCFLGFPVRAPHPPAGRGEPFRVQAECQADPQAASFSATRWKRKGKSDPSEPPETARNRPREAREFRAVGKRFPSANPFARRGGGARSHPAAGRGHLLVFGVPTFRSSR